MRSPTLKLMVNGEVIYILVREKTGKYVGLCKEGFRAEVHPLREVPLQSQLLREMGVQTKFVWGI